RFSRDWSSDVCSSDLSSLELELVLPQRDEGRLSDPLDIYLNDVLLASLAPGRSGERRREVVSLPSQILASNNFLRIELRRNAGRSEERRVGKERRARR